MNIIIESHCDKTNKMVCAPNEDSDQLGHLPSLISLCRLHEERYGLWLPIKHTAKTQIRLGAHTVGFVMMRLSCLNISNFFKHLSRELAENLSLKGNKKYLLGSTNLLVKTAQFTKQILLIITSVSLFSLHKSINKSDLNNFLEMFLTTWPPQG